jgi:hypothetical protein
MELSMSLVLADHADGGRGMRRLVDGLTHRELRASRIRRVGALLLVALAAWLDPTAPPARREMTLPAPLAR